MKEDKKYSGKILLRLPASLHKKCVEVAEEEGVSLNQLLLYAIAQLIGTKSVPKEGSEG